MIPVPQIRRIRRSILLFAGAYMACIACSSPLSSQEAHRIVSTQREEIRSLVAHPQTGSLQDCRSIPFGSNPCGGPWEQLVYSISATDSLKLIRTVRDFNAYEDRLNSRYGWFGPCVIPPPPRLGVVDGRCVAVKEQIDL